MELSDLTKDELEMICDVLYSYDDKGPVGYGWQSEELENLSVKFYKIVYGDDEECLTK